MKRQISILGVAASLWSASVAAQDGWVSIGETDAFTVFAKPSSARSTPQGVEMWTKKQFVAPGKDGETYSLALNRFDCQNRTMTLLSLVLYGAEGNMLKNFSWKPFEQEEDAIIPDSIGEAMWQSACETAAE